MAELSKQAISTLGDVFNFIAPYAGGSVPSEDDDEYGDWIRWVQVKYDEYATRGFWRRFLRKAEQDVTLDEDYDYLPNDFHKVNGVYAFFVDDVDWNEPGNTDEMVLFVEMDMDLYQEDGITANTNFGKWRIRYSTAPSETTTADLWYFANPPKPTATTDKILLPGDMIAYGVLSEYYRAAGEEGSQDDARIEAENRFNEYTSLEQLPSKHELASFSTYTGSRFDRTEKAREYYSSRVNRYRR